MTQQGESKTAKTVHGLRVVKDEPHISPHITDRQGNPVPRHQTRVLTLENGHVTYGCLHCAYTSDNLHSIRPHLNKHRGEKPNRVPTVSDLKSMSAADLLKGVNRVAELEADVEHWKGRALTAEKALERLRSALKGVG